MKILVTGAAGFIGFHTSLALIKEGYEVIGVDDLNDYYDVTFKHARLSLLKGQKAFSFYKLNIADKDAMKQLLQDHPDTTAILHLAAQAGVRYSLEKPHAYTESNVEGQLVLLEIARALQDQGTLKHFVYASSSSVYGGNQTIPFSVEDCTDLPISLYAATKIAGEMMVQSYSHLYRIPATGLRFFTVYGPYGRPDMAYFLFTKAILEGRPIKVFNHGKMKRDFTWVDDVVAGVLSAIKHVPDAKGESTKGNAPHRVFNLGNHKSENLLDFIGCIEKTLGKEAEKVMLPIAPGDVEETYADIKSSQEILGFAPKTSMEVGVPAFVEWYQSYYKEV